MHENHRRPLRKARRDFTKARKALSVLIQGEKELREQYHQHRWQGLTGWTLLKGIKAYHVLILEAIEEYQSAAEVLEIVEYALRRA